MAGPYKQSGSGTLWVPNKAADKERAEKAEKLVESLEKAIQEDHCEEQWLGGYNNGDFNLEELYIDSHGEPEIVVNGHIEDIFIGLNIPIKNNKEMQKIVQELDKIVTIDKESSGFYLKPKDFSEVRNRTADGQGRINLGKDYAGEDVRIVVMKQ